MKLADYVVQFLAEMGVRHVFAVTGGAVAHLLDSVGTHPDVEYVCTQHEQAAAMAADAYSRTTDTWGVAMATSGPGATNLMTGIACSYYDSIPTIYITGQVASFRSSREMGVRQLGFQETRVVEMMQHISKYAVMLEDPNQIRYELEKAAWVAHSGRPGPVVLDLPDDLQRAEIRPESLPSFTPPRQTAVKDARQLDGPIQQTLQLLGEAQRPVLVLGAGVHLAGARETARRLIDHLGIPVLLTWAMTDLLEGSHPLRVGSFGTAGTRFGNFTVQNADAILSIGSRLDTHATGSPVHHFARAARKVIVDIDAAELKKFDYWGMPSEMRIRADAGRFIQCLLAERWQRPPLESWLNTIRDWQRRYPMCGPRDRQQDRWVNPYALLETLSDRLAPSDVIVVDTGCCLPQTFNTLRIQQGQRLFSAFNNTPMGYALPASIGASYARNRGRVICITGDGGLQMNSQELATVAQAQLPIKILVFNNHGYGMIRETQNQWLDRRYHAASPAMGLPEVDFPRVAKAYGVDAHSVNSNQGIEAALDRLLGDDAPRLCNCELRVDDSQFLTTKYGKPIEDISPPLPRPEFLSNMLIQPLDSCTD
jgi:acetolactate synthase-1/2/3 large subunit